MFGVGQRRVVPELVRASGGEALVITDPRLADGPHLSELVDGLRAAGVSTRVFDEAAPELPLEQVPQAVAVARRGGAEVIVGFGGGSCIDLAKVVALLLAHGGSAPDYYGESTVPGSTTPVIAIPTTAGTGSEVTPVAVITDPARTSKVGISSPHLIPAAVVLADPELTVSCPPSVSAAAGADALSHGVEAFTAIRRPVTATLATERVFVGKGVLTDVFALLAVRQVAAHLRRVCQVADDLHGTIGDDARRVGRRLCLRHRRHRSGPRPAVSDRSPHPDLARGGRGHAAAVRDGLQCARADAGAGRAGHRAGRGGVRRRRTTSPRAGRRPRCVPR